MWDPKQAQTKTLSTVRCLGWPKVATGRDAAHVGWARWAGNALAASWMRMAKKWALFWQGAPGPVWRDRACLARPFQAITLLIFEESGDGASRTCARLRAARSAVVCDGCQRWRGSGSRAEGGDPLAAGRCHLSQASARLVSAQKLGRGCVATTSAARNNRRRVAGLVPGITPIHAIDNSDYNLASSFPFVVFLGLCANFRLESPAAMATRLSFHARRYVVEEMIGQGTRGWVVAARHAVLGTGGLRARGVSVRVQWHAQHSTALLTPAWR